MFRVALFVLSSKPATRPDGVVRMEFNAVGAIPSCVSEAEGLRYHFAACLPRDI